MADVSDYIKVVEGAVPLELCQRILNEYRTSDEWAPTVVGGSTNTDYRNCDGIAMSADAVVDKNKDVRSAFDAEIYKCLTSIVSAYHVYKPIPVTKDSGYDLLRYQTGGFYKEHVDSTTGTDRVLSCSIALNDDYEGGEWSFFGGEVKLKVPAGSAIVFPANYMFPHEILPVTSGSRFSIVTWLS